MDVNYIDIRYDKVINISYRKRKTMSMITLKIVNYSQSASNGSKISALFRIEALQMYYLTGYYAHSVEILGWTKLALKYNKVLLSKTENYKVMPACYVRLYTAEFHTNKY